MSDRLLKILVGTVSALLAAAALAGAAVSKTDSGQGAKARSAEKNRIDSIAPATADRGEIVTITGHGFGGQNVKVTVAGLAAEVLSATGSRASFRVPALAGPGHTTVRATNPGGHSGEIGLTVRFGGTVAPVVDSARAVSQTIGRDGGALESRGVRLQIPAGAVTNPVRITLTPLTGLSGSPLQGQVVGATFQPDGLALLKPGILSFPAPAGTKAADVLAFGFAGSGTDLHLVPHRFSGGLVELEVWHFSGAGGSFGSYVNGVPSWNPGTAETAAEQAIALAKHECERERQANPSGPHPACDAMPGRFRQALLDWYLGSVKPALQQGVGAPSFQVEDAFEEWRRWGGRAALLRDLGGLGSLEQHFDEADVLATKMVANLTRRRLENCTGTDLIPQLRDVLRMADLIEASDIDLTTEGLPNVALLVNACVGVRIDEPVFPSVAARNAGNRLAVRAYLGTYSRAQLTTVPLVVDLDVSPGFSDPSDGSLNGQGRFEADVYPFSEAVSVSVDITVDLAPGALPGLNEPIIREALPMKVTVSSLTRDRIELEALAPTTDLDPGDSVPMRVRIAGNGIAGATLTYRVTGAGTLSSTSGVTNEDGQAPTFDYVVPADAAAGGANVAARLVDGAEDSVDITIRNIALSVSPTSVSLAPGQTRQFTATVTGTPNTGVTWNATGDGTISWTGLYTAGGTAGTFSVTATSVEDRTKSATAVVTIGSAGIIEITSRSDRVRANANACAPFCTFPPGVTRSVPPGNFSEFVESVELAAASGGASASGSATITSSVMRDPAATSFSFQGGSSSTASAVVPEVSETLAEATASSSQGIAFRVSGAPVTYRLAGALRHNGDFETAAAGVGEAVLTRIEASGPQTHVEGVLVKSETRGFDTTGTLPPGRYTYFARVSCGASEMQSSGSPKFHTTGPCSADGNVSLTLNAPSTVG